MNMMSGPHAFFVGAAYAVTALVMLALVMRAVVDHRVQVRRIAELEARGIRRRSGAAAQGS